MGFDTTLEEQNPDQRYAMDSKLFVQFYMNAVEQTGRSNEEGRPIFKDVPHIRIYVPGDKTTVIDCPVEESHQRRFPAQWEKFLKGLEQSPEGTPLEQWPALTLSQVREFKAMNVYTVEQLATMQDGHVQRFMGGHELKRKAIAFLEVSKNTAAAQKYAAENAELRATLERQQDTINRMAAQLDILTAQKADAAPSASNAKGQNRERTGASPASGA